MKIKRLRIKNFQSIKDIELEFEPTGVYIITGLNHIGKSSLSRCLKMFALNAYKRGWKEFINNEADTIEVELETYEGYKIIMNRGRYNFYKIIYPDGTEEIETKLESDVPQKVKEILNFYVDPVLGESFNIRAPEDPLAFIRNRPSEVYQIIQNAIKAGDIKRAIDLGRNKQKEISNSIYDIDNRLWMIDSQLEELKIIDTEELEQAKAIIDEQINDLSLIEEIIALDNEYNSIEIKEVNWDLLYNSIEEINKQHGLLQLCEEIIKEAEQVNKLNKELEKLADISNIELDYPKEFKICEEVLDLVQKFKVITEEEKKYKELVVRAEQKVQALFKELGYCPTCNRPFNDDKELHKACV